MTEKKDQGYTMIIVMCLMFLFMALALSMLFSSAQLLARAERAGMQKQSRASAVSFAEWMDRELDKGSVDPGGSGLCKTIRKQIYTDQTWPFYKPNSAGHEAAVAVRTLNPDTATASDLEKLGDLEVSMYWETEDESADPEEKDDVELVVTVKAVVKGEQYSITTRYVKVMDVDASGAAIWNGKWSVGGRE